MHIVTLQETDDSHRQVYFFPTLFLLYLGLKSKILSMGVTQRDSNPISYYFICSRVQLPDIGLVHEILI